MSIDQLASVIQQLFEIVANPAASTADIKNATSQLSSECLIHVQAIPSLFHIIATHPNQGIRQLASVEARKLVQKNEGLFWESLDTGIREEIKQNLLKMVVSEQSAVVRHSLAHVVAETAKNEISQNRWQELVNLLYESCSSANIIHREMGVYILYSLFDVIADSMDSYLGHLVNLFTTTINDPESLMVQVTTVQALGKVADFIDAEDSNAVKQFQALIPAIVGVLQKCLDTNDDESAGKIFEVFDDILLLEAPLLSKHFVDLINLFLRISANQDYEEEIRIRSLSFLIWCIMAARSKIGKAKLIPNIIEAMFIIGAEEEPDNRDEDYPAKLAVQVINSLSTHFPPQQVFPVVMQHVIKNIQSSSPGDRKAAMLAIAVLIEGAADFMRPNVKEVLQLVIHGLQDQHVSVRKAACMALGSLCDDFESEISDQHSTILPLLFNLLNDQDSLVHGEALGTLDVFIENLGEDIIPYMNGLMEKLVSIWGSGSKKVQIATTNCIGSVAFSASKNFAPYFNEVMSRLVILMNITDTDNLPLRSCATDCVGAVATAVGVEIFRPNLQEVMKLVYNGLKFDHPQLNQCSYVLFGVLGKLFESEFIPYLQTIVPQIIQSCNAEEPYENVHTGEEAIGEVEDETPKFSTGVAQEKESSIDTLGELFEATKLAFMPFVPESINCALQLLDHYHDGVRINAAGCLLKFFNTIYVMGDQSEWEPGLPLKKPVHENVSNVGKLAVEGILLMLKDEEERYVVTQVLQQLGETLKITGPAAVYQAFAGESHTGSHLDLLANQLLSILEGEHPSQIGLSSYGESLGQEDDENLAELDALTVSVAADTVGALAAAVGPQFVPYFERFFPAISKYYKKNASVQDRSMAIGALAETVDGLEEGATVFTNDLMQFFMKGLQDTEDEVKSNAAFGIGVLVTHTTADVTSSYPTLLQMLHPLFNPNSETNMQDNACGCLCRMIIKNPTSVPLDLALPAILGCLPLTKDYAENRPIFKALIDQLNVNNEYLMSQLPRIFDFFAHVLDDPKEQLHKITRSLIVQFLNSFKSAYSANFESYLNQLGEGKASIILKSLN
ncbi:hypothetical protein HDV01_006222 [Terramyces sp. JEL0728]|nr:hypothetical protein HDV01_006222 [Terramyces sp. JEL0728]